MVKWVGSHSHIHKGVIVGSCKINLSFANDLVLLASSEQVSNMCLIIFYNCVMQLESK